MSIKQKISTFLWFDSQAVDAVLFYMSAFDNSRVLEVTRDPGADAGSEGAVLTVTFELEGQQFTALNGGPHIKFTEAISILVSCETQNEIDWLWSRLSAGGEERQCGWLKDRFGLSWQVIPTALTEMLRDPDPAKTKPVMEAMLEMTKIDVARLERAYREGHSDLPLRTDEVR